MADTTPSPEIEAASSIQFNTKSTNLFSNFPTLPPLPKRRRSSVATKTTEDVETCRICRGEATSSESLFYPCKCSGSIKYVHQDCLMEWLSHSQKKYCELCKTPFRFTKLYHPQMPSSLPTTVFAKKALSHIVSWLLVWARAALVGSVWLGALPYAMRVVWRTLFWLADGGWARDRHINHLIPQMNSTGYAPNVSDLSALPITTPFSEQSNASDATLSQAILDYSLGWTANTSASFMLSVFGQKLSLNFSLGSNPAVYNSGNDTAHELLLRRMDSLLSDVTALQNLTRWSGVNRAVINVLEGFIISLSVVVAFVLVFLIREWVVQQQPLLNMQIEENNPVLAVQEQAAEVVDQDAGAEGQPLAGQTERPNDRGTNEAFDMSTPLQTLVGDTSSSRERAEATIQSLPQNVQQAIRRGRLQEVVQVIKELPPYEAIRVKHIIVEWSKLQDSSRANLKEDELVSHFSDETPSPEDVAREESVHNVVPYDDTRPPLTRTGSSLAYEVKREIEEEDVARTGRALPSRSHPKPRNEDGDVKDDVPDNWEDEISQSYKADQSQPNGKGKAKSSDYNVERNEIPQSPQEIASSFVTLPYTRAEAQPAERLRSVDNVFESHVPNGHATEGRHNTSNQEKLSLDARDTSFESPDVDVAEGGRDQIDHGIRPDTPRPDATLHLPPTMGPSPTVSQSSTAASPVPTSYFDQVMDYLYGDLHAVEPTTSNQDQDDEHVVQNLAEEAPFVPFAGNHPAIGQALVPLEDGFQQQGANEQDPEVAAAAAEAGIDLNNQDAIDDAEDLEGMLELIGMQGPIMGLFQNALFSAVLISISISAMVWLPYCGGKLILLLVRTPIGAWFEVPIRMVSAVENFVADLVLLVFAGIFYATTSAFRFLYTICMGMDPASLDTVLQPARRITGTALERLGNATLAATAAADPNDHDYLFASMAAHASLRGMEQDLRDTLGFVFNTTSNFLTQAQTSSPTATLRLLLSGLVATIIGLVRHLASIEIPLPNIFVFDAPDVAAAANNTTDISHKLLQLDPALAFWSARDRALTAGLSYLTLAMVGCFYLSLSPPLFQHSKIRKVEQLVTDILTQAGGVLKVILIISIEMIAFPLFCGFLLDLALLPLFENATILSRITFAISRPWTSGFVHWFVGTCYMFHFALFVSMCRKIMRPGVLYFIRDPDDPTFHPVRDVLERSVATQLRKIAFSAIVYGALIMLCLGGVVWGLWAAFNNILPLHWSSTKSALEFPLDILFYNFLTPIVLRYAKPSDGLHTMYRWWFRRCARFLRLSDFLFGERRHDEEGYSADSSFTNKPKQYLQDGVLVSPGPSAQQEQVNENKTEGSIEEPPETGFIKTGRYVRAPATDQVRIPKGEPVFIPVTEDNKRLDGKPEEEGIHALSSRQTKQVYIPPWFTFRISAFAVTIWLFAAVTGCGITIVPLIAGRWMIMSTSSLFGTNSNADTKVNDIYAFSLGFYTLGGMLYLALHIQKASGWIQGQVGALRRSLSLAFLGNNVVAAGRYIARVVRVLYVWSAVIVGLPFVFAAVLELYLLLPLHALSTDVEKPAPTKDGTPSHTVHLVQDWTLGMLYSHIVVKLILSDSESLLSRAARAVTAQGGMWNPDAKLATRYFILPFSLFFSFVIGGPFVVAQMANGGIFVGESEEVKLLVRRLAYPVCAAFTAAVLMVYLLTEATERWRGRIRDEVYLIGERLHNFGERKAAARSSAEGRGENRQAGVASADYGL